MKILTELFALFWLLILISAIILSVGILVYFIFWEHNPFVIAGVAITLLVIIFQELFHKNKDQMLRIKYAAIFPDGLPVIVTDDTARVEQLKLRLNEDYEPKGILWIGDDFITYLLNPDISTSIITPMNVTDEITERHMFEIETNLPQGIVKTHIGAFCSDIHKVDKWYFQSYGLTPAEMNNACIMMSDHYISDEYLIRSAALFADMTYPHKLFITRNKSVKRYLDSKTDVRCIYSKDYNPSYWKFLGYIHKTMRE